MLCCLEWKDSRSCYRCKDGLPINLVCVSLGIELVHLLLNHLLRSVAVCNLLYTQLGWLGGSRGPKAMIHRLFLLLLIEYFYCFQLFEGFRVGMSLFVCSWFISIKLIDIYDVQNWIPTMVCNTMFSDVKESWAGMRFLN